jgi:ribosomal-protein-alanine N-acetyltransferase
MEIQTEQLILRPLCMDDLHTVHEWVSDAEYMKYTNTPHTDLSETLEYLEWVTKEWQSDHQTYYSFGIMLGDKLIGEIGFSNGCGKCGRCVEGEAAIGYGFPPNFQNCGYETEVLKAIIEYCFKELGAKIIKNAVDIENLAEIRVIESLGFQLKTENEDCEYNDGKPFKRNIYHLNNYYSK